MSSTRRQYPFHLIEPKWQAFWDRDQTFRAFNPGETIPAEHPFGLRHGLAGQAVEADTLPPKFYILDMFPYPSGAGLHVGHPEGYTATDILARYRRAQGRHVLHPMGWDAFGLPAEQYAVKTGQHPRVTTEANVATFKRQIQSLGFSYDWSREVDTTDPGYFRWTQWIFLQLYHAWFNPQTQRAEPLATLPYPADCVTEAQRRAHRDERRLAYVSEAPVNWCPELGTVLANEEVIDGRSEVGGFPVVRRPMRQWMLRITAFAERLLRDLDTIDWSDSLKEMQRNWIGRSEGAEVEFRLEAVGGGGSRMPDAGCRMPDAAGGDRLRVFTTRPDTLFGATYMVLSPEHELVARITTPEQRQAVQEYQAFAASRSDLERTELAKEKTGVFTGAYALNPVNGRRIPVWIADYVLISYGTGAIMAVPAHDTRDFEFATKFGLPIVQVVQPPDAATDWRGFTGDGVAVNSTGPEIAIDGLPTPEAKRKITAWLEAQGLGRKTVNFKLRDWLFSRQRYWGEPFPIVWRRAADGTLFHEALPDHALPVLPPSLDDYKPTADGQPPLARAQEWLTLPDGAVRETNTMPQWAGSCWYYLRYLDASNVAAFTGSQAERYWMGGGGGEKSEVRSPKSEVPGVDLYVGGTEHAVLHLLYARFWHKVLFDLGHVSTPEPFYKLVNQGLILGEVEYLVFQAVGAAGSPAAVSADDLVNITPMQAGAARAAAYHKDHPKGDVILGFPVPQAEVAKTEKGFVLRANPAVAVHAQCFKMSKSRGNVVNPDDILREYGADAFRLYEMFMGPLEMVKPWNTQGVEGVYRFLGRVWRLFVDERSETAFEQAETTTLPEGRGALLAMIQPSPAITADAPTPAQLKVLHACIRKVTEDLDGMRFNTAISAMMVFVNEAMTWPARPRAVLAPFLQLLAPFAPHLAEELWARLHAGGPVPSLSYSPWPVFDPALLVEDTLEIPVQVNGKLRDRVVVPAGAPQAEIEQAALRAEKVRAFVAGRTVRKIIVVPGRLVNIVVA